MEALVAEIAAAIEAAREARHRLGIAERIDRGKPSKLGVPLHYRVTRRLIEQTRETEARSFGPSKIRRCGLDFD